MEMNSSNLYNVNSIELTKFCRVCLSYNKMLLSLGDNDFRELFSLLLGSEVSDDPSINWLCFGCAHFIKKLSLFRNICIRTDNMLKEYCFDDSKNIKKTKDFLEFQRDKMHIISKELIISNTLCMDIKTESCEQNSVVEVLSYASGCTAAKNFSEDMITVYTKCATDVLSSNDVNIKSDNQTRDEIDESLCGPSIKYDSEDTLDADEISEYFKNTKKRVSLETYENSSDSDNDTPFALDESNEDNVASPVNRTKENDWQKRLEIMNTTKNREDIIVRDLLNTKEELDEDRKKKACDPVYLKSLYKCEPCIMGFQHYNTLELHMKKHDPTSGKHGCEICGQYFNSQEKLWQHTYVLHRLRLICKLCGIRLRDDRRAFDHERMHEGHPYACKHCSAVFTSHRGLSLHTFKHIKTKYKCKLCFAKFRTSETLEKHESRCDISPDSKTCKDCGKVFRRRATLTVHRETHHRVVKFYCVECDLNFKSDYSLQKHFTSHKAHIDTDSLKFSCEKCPRKYATLDKLTLHIENKHEGVPRYTCAICGAKYSTVQGLNFHRRKVHEGTVKPKKYPCQICDKVFTTRSSLKSHTLTHTGQRPHACTQCEWTFTQRSTLKTHVRLVHEKIKLPEKKKKGYSRSSTNREDPSSSCTNTNPSIHNALDGEIFNKDMQTS